jgi:hypothetical protein
MRPHEIEDFMCIFKGRLGHARRPFALATGDADCHDARPRGMR